MRTRAVLLGALGVVLGIQGTASADPDPAPVQAVAADSVVDKYGVGIHSYHLDTPYADAGAVAAALAELGVRHVRDDLYLGTPRQYAAIGTIADAGVRFDLILGRPDGGATPADYVETVARKLPAGAVESLEGVNEWDLVGGENWVAEMKSWQDGIWAAAHANPATAKLPILSPALAFRWNYAAAGNLEPHADIANAHMYPGGHRPSNQISQITEALLNSISGKPVISTEAGYHNATASSTGHPGVPEDVAGAYLPRLLLEHVARGERRMYSYELIDSFADPGLTDPEAHFGLLRHDLTPKPAYTAMKSLLGLLADPGPSFGPGSLAVTADGLPGDARYLLTQKRTGEFVLLLWRDVSLYDPDQQQYLPVTPTDVTLRLGEPADLTVHRPSDPDAADVSTRGTSLPLQLDGQVTAITIVPATVPGAPRIGSARAGRHKVTVAWAAPEARGRPVTAYRLTALGRTVRVAPDRLRATIRGLPAGKRVRVAVRAQNELGWGRPAYTRYLTIKRGTPPA